MIASASLYSTEVKLWELDSTTLGEALQEKSIPRSFKRQKTDVASIEPKFSIKTMGTVQRMLWLAPETLAVAGGDQ